MGQTAQASTGAQSGARRGPTRLFVGDHVGEPAGDAAQAVRRAGMRPALDRSFGHAPAETGRVIEQDPPTGTPVARNAMVTLYVAAPAPAPDGPDEPSPRERAVGQDEQGGKIAAPAGMPVEEPEWRSPSRGATPRAIAADVAAAATGEERTEVKDPAAPSFEDPFSRDAEGPPRLRAIYPRKPLRLTLRSAGRRVGRYRLAALAALVSAAVIAAHATGARPRPSGGIVRGATQAVAVHAPARTTRRHRPAVVPRSVAPRRRPRHPSPTVRPRRAATVVAATPSQALGSSPARAERPSGAAGGPFSP